MERLVVDKTNVSLLVYDPFILKSKRVTMEDDISDLTPKIIFHNDVNNTIYLKLQNVMLITPD